MRLGLTFRGIGPFSGPGRITVPPPRTAPLLSALSLSSSVFAFGVPSSGTITGASLGSTITVSTLPAGLTVNGAARTWAWDGTGTGATGNFTLTETLAGATNSPLATVISYTITGGAAALGALTFSATSFQSGVPATGTINGATVGSAIGASGLPSGLTINGAARTWAWDGSRGPGTGSFTLTESLTGSPNSPRNSVIPWTVFLSATGTLSAPTLGYPSGGLLPVTIPNDWQSGASGSPIDALVIAKSSAENMSSPTLFRYNLQDTDTPGSTIHIGLDMTGKGYLVGFGSHLGTDSQYLSNKVGFGDATKPIIATSATQSHPELTQYAVAITADKTISKAEIAGGADQVQYEVYQDGSGNWFYRPFDNGTFNYDASVFVGGGETGQLQITVWDLFGNASDPLNISDTVTAVDKKADVFDLGADQGPPSTAGQTYQAPNLITVTGIAPGISIPWSVTNGTAQKNGTGSYASSGTAQLNDTLRVEAVAPSTGETDVTLSLGSGASLVSDTWKITTDTAVLEWRLYATATGPGSDRFRLAELEMHATVGGANIMTGGTAIQGNNEFGAFPASNMLDGNLATVVSVTTLPNYVGYTFPSDTPTVAEIVIKSGSSSNDASWTPTAFYLAKMVNGSPVTVKSWTTGAWSTSQSRTFVV